MTDNAELKRLAAAIESCASIPEEDESAWMRRTTGEKVLLLIEEVDELKAENDRLTTHIADGMDCKAVAIQGMARLTAENEALRNPDAHAMLELAQSYWVAQRNAGERGAVKWIQDEETGATMIFTRGEYRDVLMAAVASIEGRAGKDADQ